MDAGLDGLATARLKLRRFTTDDLPLLQALNSDVEVMRYLGGVETAEQTCEALHGRILSYYDQHPGYGVWATLERDSGACIGFHLLNDIRGSAHIQIGYRLLPQYWGRGYATEMSLALMRYGYTQLKLAQLTAITHIDNAGSQQVLLKAGLHRKGERVFDHPAYRAFSPLAWFERDATDWLAEFGA